MPATQIVSGVLLIVIMLGLAAFQIRRQLAQLRALRAGEVLADDERHYLRQRALRRIWASAILTVLAIFLTVALLFLEAPAQVYADAPPDEPTPEQRRFIRVYTGFWIVFLLLLLAVLVLAALDYWATRRFGAREFQRLQADRRAMIETLRGRLREEGSPNGD